MLWTLGIQLLSKSMFLWYVCGEMRGAYVYSTSVQYEVLESAQHLTLLLLPNLTRSATVHAMLGNNESKIPNAAFAPKHF